MSRRRQYPPGYRRSVAIRVLTMLAFLSSMVLAAIQLPRSVLADTGRDPVWNARLKDVPPWLEMPKKPGQLYTEYQLPTLAGRLITYGDVNSQGCPNGGLKPDRDANSCGMQRAQPEIEHLAKPLQRGYSVHCSGERRSPAIAEEYLRLGKPVLAREIVYQYL